MSFVPKYVLHLEEDKEKLQPLQKQPASIHKYQCKNPSPKGLKPLSYLLISHCMFSASSPDFS